MTTDQFWKIIEDARAEDPEPESVAVAVGSILKSLSTDEVLGFERELTKRQAESYRWDLWAIAYIANGGCSDDGFEYFRGWLIAKGRSYYEAALADPVRAADDAEPDANECEDMLYVAAQAYKAKTGSYPPKSDVPFPKEPAGKSWDEDELETLYPQLWERFT
ncbi:MAG: DUF4240 domain-containing protein [Nibricoccus sp.]